MTYKMGLPCHPFTKPKEKKKIVLPQENNFYIPRKEKPVQES